MTEFEETVRLALKLLDEPNADPDDVLRMLSRQFLRALEISGEYRRKWTLYEQEYFLPCFDVAKESGIDLRKLVTENPGTNCVILLLKILQEQADVETKRRIYYQDIVYTVCNTLDRIDGNKPGAGLVCGTDAAPSKQVQERIERLVQEVTPDEN